jgi:hypothetical protein
MLKRIGACLLALVAAAAMTGGAAAQSGEPIKIGFAWRRPARSLPTANSCSA